MTDAQAAYSRRALDVRFLTTVVPTGRRSGGEIVSQGFLDAMTAHGANVAVVGWWPPDPQTLPTRETPADESDAGGSLRIVAAGRRHIETADAPRRVKARWLMDALARRMPYSAAKYRGDSYVEAIAAAGHADIVVVDHAQVAWALDGQPQPGPVVHIAYNVEHRLYEDSAAGADSRFARMLLAREGRLVRTVEVQLAAHADVVWTLTEDDGDAFRRLGARRVVSFAVPGRAGTGTPTTSRSGIRLIGNWTWMPNAEGLRWFCSEVVPRLPDGTEIVVAGGGADWLATHPRIRYLGRVDDADAFIAGARVLAVPSIAGAGVQIKTLDAIAAGGWLVATPFALRGIADPPPSVTASDDPQAFAAALERLLADPVTLAPSTESLEWSARRRDAFVAQVAAELDGLGA